MNVPIETFGTVYRAQPQCSSHAIFFYLFFSAYGAYSFRSRNQTNIFLSEDAFSKAALLFLTANRYPRHFFDLLPLPNGALVPKAARRALCSCGTAQLLPASSTAVGGRLKRYPRKDVLTRCTCACARSHARRKWPTKDFSKFAFFYVLCVYHPCSYGGVGERSSASRSRE